MIIAHPYLLITLIFNEEEVRKEEARGVHSENIRVRNTRLLFPQKNLSNKKIVKKKKQQA